MKYIACFGDSLIQGFPFGPAHSWTAAVEKTAPLKMLNYGLCGDCCDDILYRMRQRPLPEYVRHLLFLGGANDILQFRSQKMILEDLKKVLRFCQEHQLQLCIVLPLISAEDELNAHILPLREQITAQFAEAAYLLDLQPAIGLDAGARKKAYLDGVHPKAPTYEAMGIYAAPLLAAWTEK